jgi:hypothetical protein
MTSMFILVTPDSNTLHEINLLMEAFFNKNVPYKHTVLLWLSIFFLMMYLPKLVICVFKYTFI